jgi:hypothetical protein
MRRFIALLCLLLILISMSGLTALAPRRVQGVVRDALNGESISGAVVLRDDLSVYSDHSGRYRLGWIHSTPTLTVYADGYLMTDADVPKGCLPGQVVSLHITLMPNAVSGTVRDAETGDPLPGGIVRAARLQIAADQNGHYVLRRVKMGSALSAASPGYKTVSAIFNGQSEQEFQLVPTQTTVRVRDLYSGDPVADARVLGASAYAVDGDGIAVIKRLSRGVVLSIEAAGYDSAQPVFDGQDTISVMLRPNTLQGVVTDASDGQPIAEALVVAMAGEQVIGSHLTGQDGRYQFEGLPPSLELTATATDYEQAHAAVNGTTEMDLQLEPFSVRGIYIPFGLLTSEPRVHELIDLVDRTELNTVVVDVKSDRGWLAYASDVPEAQHSGAYKPAVMDISTFLALCREKGIYTIGRLVLFKDPLLAAAYPAWAVRTDDDLVWIDSEGSAWGDPFRSEVQDYNIAIAKEVATLGFDELQFDYLRFPSDGAVDRIRYAEESTAESRSDTIAGFCARLRAELDPYAIVISADVFGLTVWVSPEEDMGIGQRVVDIAPYVDYISPMLYPATFRRGNLGYEDPLQHPYQVVYRSCIELGKRIQTHAPISTERAKVRPWLQHYSANGVVYGVEEMSLQMQAAADAHTDGWMFWNAAGRYLEEAFAPAQAE